MKVKVNMHCIQSIRPLRYKLEFYQLQAITSGINGILTQITRNFALKQAKYFSNFI